MGAAPILARFENIFQILRNILEQFICIRVCLIAFRMFFHFFHFFHFFNGC